MHERSDYERFAEGLPWWANGTLGSDERRWMEEYAQQHPDAAAEQRVEQLLRVSLQTDAVADEVDAGLAAVLRRVRQDDTSTSRRSRTGLADWLRGLGLTPRSPAAILMGLLLILQFTQWGNRFWTTHTEPMVTEQWRSSGGTAAEGPFLRMTFKPQTREEELRMLLARINGTIVAGPGQLGNYIVRVPPDTFAKQLEWTRRADIVESVERIDTLPESD